LVAANGRKPDLLSDEKLVLQAVGAGSRVERLFEDFVEMREVFESAIKTDFEDLLGSGAEFLSGKFHAGGIDSLCRGDSVEALEAGIHMLGSSPATFSKRLRAA
jgi:hypothetical protein